MGIPARIFATLLRFSPGRMRNWMWKWWYQRLAKAHKRGDFRFMNYGSSRFRIGSRRALDTMPGQSPTRDKPPRGQADYYNAYGNEALHHALSGPEARGSTYPQTRTIRSRKGSAAPAAPSTDEQRFVASLSDVDQEDLGEWRATNKWTGSKQQAYKLMKEQQRARDAANDAYVYTAEELQGLRGRDALPRRNVKRELLVSDDGKGFKRRRCDRL